MAKGQFSKPQKTSPTIRLNKFIADSGVCSRREADRLIAEGSITVNGKRVFEMGTQVHPHNDKILLNGKPIKQVTMKLYLAFNKPTGVLTTMDDPEGRPTIADYLKDVPVRVFPIGRLDWDSEGLVILTNDGEFSQKVSHPKNEVTKTYLLKLARTPTADQIQRLLRGVTIMGGKVSAKVFEKVKKGSGEHPWFKIIITEGKNRQIRQMIEKINNDVIKLQRIAIGRFGLGTLERGELAYINEQSLSKLFQPDLPKEALEKKIGGFTIKSKSPAKKRRTSSKRLGHS